MTFKGVIKSVLAIAIIVAGAAIGWAVATSSNPYAPGNSTGTPQAAANVTVVPNTPLPTFTPVSTTPGAGATPGQPGAGAAPSGTPGQAGATTTPGQRTGQGNGGQRQRPITGTVESYDAAGKILTVKTSDGKSEKVGVSSARLTKNQKLSTNEFSKLASSGIVIVTGDKNSDGSYNARTLTAVDPTAAGGGAGGFGGAAGGNGGGQAGGNGGATGGAGGFGGANAPVIIQGGKLDGKTFSGSSFTGETIKVNLADDTTLTTQATATADDLKAGSNVSVAVRTAAQGDTPADAQSVTLTAS